MSDAAIVLLDRRLAVRAVAAALGLGIAAAAVIAEGLSFATSDVERVGAANRTALAWHVASTALLSIGLVGWSLLIRFGERRIAATLTRRVSRDAGLRVWRRLGGIRAANCAVTVVASLVPLAVMIATGASPTLIAVYGSPWLVTVAVVASTLRDLAVAPALAVDASSLAVDDRLRSRAAYQALLPLVLLMLGVTVPVGLLAHPRSLDVIMVWVVWLGVLPLWLEAVAAEREAGRFDRWLPRWGGSP